MSHRKRKALIIGAGIAGPVTAILLKRAGFEAAVYEAWSYSTGIGGGLQIAPNGMHVLNEIGLASELTSRGAVCESFDFYSQNGARLGSINRNMQARFGQPAVNMKRAMLNEALVDKAWSSCVEMHFEKRLARIEDRPDRPIVATFTDGSTAEGDLLIGADGVHSTVRQHPRRPKALRHRPPELWRFRAAVAPRRCGVRPPHRGDVRPGERFLRLRLLQR